MDFILPPSKGLLLGLVNQDDIKLSMPFETVPFVKSIYQKIQLSTLRQHAHCIEAVVLKYRNSKEDSIPKLIRYPGNHLSRNDWIGCEVP